MKRRHHELRDLPISEAQSLMQPEGLVRILEEPLVVLVALRQADFVLLVRAVGFCAFRRRPGLRSPPRRGFGTFREGLGHSPRHPREELAVSSGITMSAPIAARESVRKRSGCGGAFLED